MFYIENVLDHNVIYVNDTIQSHFLSGSETKMQICIFNSLFASAEENVAQWVKFQNHLLVIKML